MTNVELKILQERYNKNLGRFRVLINSQDLLREILCREEGEVRTELLKLDKAFSKAINNFGIKHSIGSVTNQNFDE